MNIEEYIKYHDEEAPKYRKLYEDIGGEDVKETADMHEKHADWLKELQRLRKAWEDVRAEIAKYETDCICTFIASDEHDCKQCTINTFESIKDIMREHLGKLEE